MTRRILSVGDCLAAFIRQENNPAIWQYDLVGAEMNFLIGCARLGIHTGLISSLSTDRFGTEILARLKKESIDTSQISRSELPTALVFRDLHEEQSRILSYYRKNTAGSRLTHSSIDEKYVAASSHFHFTGIFPALGEENRQTLHHLLRQAHEHKLCISFDANIRSALFHNDKSAQQLLLPYIEQCDIFLSGLEEAQFLLNTKNSQLLCRRLEELGVQDIVLKMGSKGCLGFSQGEQLVKLPPKTKVMDPTGAGDAFDAGYIYAYRQGWSLEKKLSFASLMGSKIAASASDNQNFPRLEEISI